MIQAKQLPQAGTSRYRWQQLVHSMPPAALRVPGQPVRRDLAHTTLSSRSYKHLTVVSAAATAVKTKPAAQQYEIPRGTTAGTVLEVEGVTVSVGEVDLMVDVDWKMMPGQRVGLVGSNGCGKSTLLKIMCGQRPVDAGRLIVGHKVEVGYLEQTAVSGSENSVWQEARSRMTDLVAAEEAMEAASQAALDGNEKAGDMMTKAQDDWYAAGGPDADKRVANVLNGLGFKQDQWSKSCSEFSGGWQMRIALARLLLSDAGQAATGRSSGGLLLLDEPTNHLDAAACKWLANFLRNSSGSVIIVSHDESLLEGACNTIVEVRGRKLHHYVGTYSKFLAERTLREQQALAQAEAQQVEIEKLESFINRFGAKASKATQAQSKMKALEKLKAEAVEAPAAASSVGGGDAKSVTLRFPPAPPCFTDVITMQDAAIGWGSADSGNDPLLTNIDLIVKKGQRILVLGPNGAGKSTLMKMMAGQLAPWAGTRSLGDGVKLGVFAQDLAQELPLDSSALDYVLDTARVANPGVTMEMGRKALGALGLNGPAALRRIGNLSGGEKARVALASFSLVPHNVLLLDEASNHLDAQTINVLTGALQDFKGAIIAITHNQLFAESLQATHILRVANGAAKLEANMGLTAADFQHEAPAAAPKGKGAKGGKGDTKGKGKAAAKASTPAAATPEPAAAKPAAAVAAPPAKAAPAKKGSSKPKKLGYYEQQEYEKLGKDMAVLQAQLGSLETQVVALSQKGDVAAASASSQKMGDISERLAEMELRWLELAELAGDL